MVIYSINRLSKFTHNPVELHGVLLKCLDFGLIFQGVKGLWQVHSGCSCPGFKPVCQRLPYAKSSRMLARSGSQVLTFNHFKLPFWNPAYYHTFALLVILYARLVSPLSASFVLLNRPLALRGSKSSSNLTSTRWSKLCSSKWNSARNWQSLKFRPSSNGALYLSYSIVKKKSLRTMTTCCTSLTTRGLSFLCSASLLGVPSVCSKIMTF